MKKIYLNSTAQFNHNCSGDYYNQMANMRDVSRVIAYKRAHGQPIADDQRPVDEKHVAKIVTSVKEEKRLYLWTVMIAVFGPMSIKHDDYGDYIDWPETEEEMAELAQYIQLGDGQHRAVAFTEEYHLWDIVGECYPVSITVLNNPSRKEMMERFCEINARNKVMDKNLTFDLNAKMGKLSDHKLQMNAILHRANDDHSFPLCGKIKFGCGSGKYAASTIVNYAVSDSRDLIQAMEDANVTSEDEKYKVFMRYWQAVMMENASDCTGGSLKRPHGKSVSMSATRIGYITSMAETVIDILKFNQKNRTVNNMQAIYHKLLHDVLGVNKSILENDGSTMVYTDSNGEEIAIVSNRWNSSRSVRTAIQADHDLLVRAYANDLRIRR